MLMNDDTIETFDYTEWQREYFDKISPEKLDSDMDRYFADHPYSGDSSKLILI